MCCDPNSSGWNCWEGNKFLPNSAGLARKKTIQSALIWWLALGGIVYSSALASQQPCQKPRFLRDTVWAILSAGMRVDSGSVRSSR